MKPHCKFRALWADAHQSQPFALSWMGICQLEASRPRLFESKHQPFFLRQTLSSVSNWNGRCTASISDGNFIDHAGAKQNGRFSDEVTNLDQTTGLFLSMLIPINQLNQIIPEERQSLILAHTLANYALIHLHHATAHDNSVSFAKCSRAARACVNVMKQINDQDYPFLDPILAVSISSSSWALNWVSSI